KRQFKLWIGFVILPKKVLLVRKKKKKKKKKKEDQLTSECVCVCACVLCAYAEKMDWEKWKDADIPTLANRYVQCWCNNSRDSESTNKLRWLKVRITLQVTKHVINECIFQKCQVPLKFIEQVVISLVEIDPMLSSTTATENTLQATKALKEFIKRFHEKSEEDEDWDTLQSELKQIEDVSLSREPDPFINLYYIVSHQNTKSLRIYLYCPQHTDYKQRRIRSIFFPSTPEVSIKKWSHTKKTKNYSENRFLLRLVKADIPWLYWGDFQVSASNNSFCRVYSRTEKKTEADIPLSTKAFIIEEKSFLSTSKNYSKIIVDHLKREIKDEKSFCAAVTIAKDLKSLQLELAGIRTIFDAVAPHLNHLDS
ncbi:hypothetical protein RFI_39193, partial [Reticulomyxa filosa]